MATFRTLSFVTWLGAKNSCTALSEDLAKPERSPAVTCSAPQSSTHTPVAHRALQSPGEAHGVLWNQSGSLGVWIRSEQPASKPFSQPRSRPVSQPASQLTHNDCGKESSGRQGKTKRPWSESPRMPPNMNTILSKEIKKS